MNNRLYQFIRKITTFLLKLIYGIKIINKDYIPENGPIIFVGNHKHNYDGISLMSTTKRPISFLAKKELLDKHGWLFSRLGIIPVNRNAKNKEAIEKAVSVLNNGGVIGIFPEGTFNKTEYIVRPFKYGAVKISSMTHAPIVPFAIVGEYKIFKRNIKIVFGKPYYVEDKKDLTKENIKLMNKVIRLMKGNVDEKQK